MDGDDDGFCADGGVPALAIRTGDGDFQISLRLPQVDTRGGENFRPPQIGLVFELLGHKPRRWIAHQHGLLKGEIAATSALALVFAAAQLHTLEVAIDPR